MVFVFNMYESGRIVSMLYILVEVLLRGIRSDKSSLDRFYNVHILDQLYYNLFILYKIINMLQKLG